MHRRRTSQPPANNVASTSLGCFALGAGLVYFLDPAQGTRRRSQIVDALTGATRSAGRSLQKSAKDACNRAVGIAAQAKGRLAGGDDVATDETIVARVRSAMGRAVSHPRAVRVTSRGGTVYLSGHVLSDEEAQLLSTIGKVRCVGQIVNRLTPHHEPGNVPDLQPGDGDDEFVPTPPATETWTPATRMLAAGGGLTLLTTGVARGGLLGWAAAGAGGALFLRAATNLSASQLTGIGAGAWAVEVRKSINILAPRDLVFGFFSQYANFPRFMANVVGVRDFGDGRSHWTVKGPFGKTVSWDATLLDYVPSERIAWQSDAESVVENAGVLRFSDVRTADGEGTRVDVQLSYNPPAGALGHAVAKLFGSDAKTEFDHDLIRVKTYLERGEPARDAAQADDRSLIAATADAAASAVRALNATAHAGRRLPPDANLDTVERTDGDVRGMTPDPDANPDLVTHAGAATGEGDLDAADMGIRTDNARGPRGGESAARSL